MKNETKNKAKFSRVIGFIESYIPMTFSSLIIFVVIIYLFIVIGRTISNNYNSNKELEQEEQKVLSLEEEIDGMRNQINYFQTSSFKEKEARQKLGYKAPGESVLSLPIDQEDEKSTDVSLGEVKIKTPNYRYWWAYFFE